MTHSYIAISTHDGEEDGAGELVDAGRRHVGFAHDAAKWPRLAAHRGEQERDTNQETFVCHCQVHDVQICDCLHLREANYHVDDKGVAK